MIPLRNDQTTDNLPFFTLLIIAVNLFVYGYQLSLPAGEMRSFIETWGFIPARVWEAPLQLTLLTLFTSLFLHGGVLHIGGNMLYLWVFGDNVEDELGSLKFIFFYILAGLCGTVSQFILYPSAQLPVVGASGAIAGVLGAYLLLFPRAKILTALIIVIFVRIVYLPAWILLGFWILIQFMHGLLMIGSSGAGGVAWFAHIGGFITGIIFISLVFAGTGRLGWQSQNQVHK
jgi:membrane associated rhomboid family serine protease